jgi:hypothetical protein
MITALGNQNTLACIFNLRRCMLEWHTGEAAADPDLAANLQALTGLLAESRRVPW